MHGEDKPEWAKVFLSVLKLLGARLIAVFTAILTQYLIRARPRRRAGVRRVPDGGHVVVCGLGNVGYRLVTELTAMGERVVAIDRADDGPFIATVRRSGVPAFVGDATVVDVLKQVRAGEAKAVIAATSSELANLEIALCGPRDEPRQRRRALSDPQFAEAVREAADIRNALSIPALAAPRSPRRSTATASTALVTAAGRTLVVIEIVIDADETYLVGKSLRALSLDYRLLPVAFAGRDLATLAGYRLQVGDRLTAVAEMRDVERMIRRESVPSNASVMVDAHPVTAKESLAALVRVHRNCSGEEAAAMLDGTPFTLATGLSRGEAQEMVEQVTREKVSARVVAPDPTEPDHPLFSPG